MLPGDLATVTLTGRFLAADGAALNGTVAVEPSANLTDSAGRLMVWRAPQYHQLAGGAFTTTLAATDSGLLPAGWSYTLTVAIQGAPVFILGNVELPAASSPVDIADVLPAAAQSIIPAAPWMLKAGGTPAAGDAPVAIGDGTGTAWQPVALLGGAWFTGFVAPAVADLDDGAVITPDATAGNHFRVIISGDRTLAAPLNGRDAQTIIVEVIQDSQGGHSLAYGTGITFSDSLSAPAVSAGPGKRTFLGLVFTAAGPCWDLLSFGPGYPATA